MNEPLFDYDLLTLHEARARYAEVEKTFAEVRGGYSLIDRLWRKKMRENDIESLKGCVGVLIPLSFAPVVQNEVDRTAHYNGTLHSRINALSQDLLSFAGRFKNTGVHFAGMEVDEVVRLE